MAETLTKMSKKSSQKTLRKTAKIGISFPLDISNTCEDYLSEFEIADNMDHNLTHKYYGHKRKELPNYNSEIFPLPDDPIFSNASHFLNQISKSPLDIETADPWDLSLINLNYVDCPWLVDSLLVSEHVKTPYSHVDSLFLCDEVRHKVEPKNKGISVANANSPDWSASHKTKDSLFTSTPVKSQGATVEGEGSKVAAPVVTSIEIAKKVDDNVDLAVIKDHVIKALEQVIKSKNSMTNIDMKIQIVAGPNESLSTPAQKACVKVKIDESTETASSSKENQSLEISNLSVDEMTGSKQSQILAEDCSNSISSSTDLEVSTSGTLEIKKSMAGNLRRKKRKRFLLPTRRSARSLRMSNNVSAENSKENETNLLKLQKPDNSNINLIDSGVNGSLNSPPPVLVKNGVIPNNNQMNNEKCDPINIFSLDPNAKHQKRINGHVHSEITSSLEDDTTLITKEIKNQAEISLNKLSNAAKYVNGPINDKLLNKHSQFIEPARKKCQGLSNGIIKLNGQSMARKNFTEPSGEVSNNHPKNGRKGSEFEGMLPSDYLLTKDFDTYNKSPIVENNNVTTKKRVLRSSFKALNDHVELNTKDKRRETCDEVHTIEAAVYKFSNDQTKHRYSSNSFDMSNSITNPISPVCYQSDTLPSFNSILKTTNNNHTSVDMGNEVLNELPELSREDEDKIELENKDHKSLMKQNGIINRVKIVLNPLSLEDQANSNHEKEDCPVLSAELPLIEAEKAETSKLDNISQPDDSLANIPDIMSTVEENKVEVKKPNIYTNFKMVLEDKVYQIGDLVWAQVARYPYWPAIICMDPVTNKYLEQVENKRKLNSHKWLYHLKFFGDHGRRAWVNKLNLLPYYDRDDLNKEGLRNQYFLGAKIKPAFRKGNKKWQLAVEEIESQKHNPYQEILENIHKNSLLYWEKRRESRKKSLDASSESESEETTTSEKPQNKYFPIKQNNSVELDEINLSVGMKPEDIQVKPGASESTFLTSMNDKSDVETSRESQRNVRRSGRSVKSVDKLDMLKLQKKMVLNPVALSSQTPIKIEDESCEQDEVKESHDVDKEQCDRTSEVGSKSSSDTTASDSNMYSFEYQLELHKRNNLYQRLKNIKVCDYCLKQGNDVQKCKGKCNGSYHPDCAASVMQPRSKIQPKRDKSPSKSRRFDVPRRSEEGRRTRSQTNCEIITIKSKHVIDVPVKESIPQDLSIAEQIDFGMKEMMSKFTNGKSVYQDSTDSGSDDGSVAPMNNLSLDSPSSFSTAFAKIPYCCNDDIKSSENSEICLSSEGSNSYIKHVTADCVELMDPINVMCAYCRTRKDPPCFACGLEVSKKGDSVRQKCSTYRCGRYFHVGCLKLWPQTQWPISGKWSKDSFTCPSHRCHTCFSEELGSSVSCRLPGDKLARCLLCPAAFHATTFCTPAGCEILGGSQILCPRHRTRPIQPINTIWCFICSQGGNLVCCDSCPTSVHPECQPVLFTDDDKYICEDCESGRFPLYDEIVWVKLGHFRWWPAIILFPNEVPANVRSLKRQKGDFVVQFFGTNDYHWVNKSRSFLFQEGDTGDVNPKDASRLKGKVYELFGKAVEDAAKAYQLKKEFKLRREAECIDSLKPPHYIKINKSKPVGKVKYLELNLSSATACECNPNVPFPCGPDGNCINRLLMTECDPTVCPAGNRCRNQAFQKREYPLMVPYKTQGRGWGLKSLAPIKKGQFIIEYVGELIDSEEYQRRIKKMHEKKEENYYFMTVDGDRMIDAGPKGNISRFMNHSCDPNCVTQKWTVKGETRVGLFAKCNIESGSELTFNYNLEVVGQEKKICKCGASNCSGFIGVKATKLDKTDKLPENAAENAEQPKKTRKYVKKSLAPEPIAPPCFVCGKKNSNVTCNNKFCNKGYHLKCLELTEMPDASKYTCPRHNCKICTHRTIRSCVKCTNSFCPSHSDGNVRYDELLGFVCRLHDPGISTAGESSNNTKECIELFRPPVLNEQKEFKLSTKDLSDEEVNSAGQGESLIRSVENLQNPKKQIHSKNAKRNRSKPGKTVKRKLSLFAKESNQTGKLRNAKTNQSIKKEKQHLDINIEAENGSSVAAKSDLQTYRTPAIKRRRPRNESPLDECTSPDESTTRHSAKLVSGSETDDLTPIRPESPVDLDDVSLSERLSRWRENVPRKRRRFSVTRFPATEKST